METGRHVPLDGASNFRDFGGYAAADGRTVRWGRLYRSDRLSELTVADFARLAGRGVRLVFDLRRESETKAAPTRWAGPDAPRLISSPMFDDEAGPNTFKRVEADAAARHDPARSRAIMAGMYQRMVTWPGPLATLRGMLERLAEPQAYPALFHCAGGKDRTGVACAIILSALGVGREDITADFMLTRRYYDSAANLGKRVAQVVAEAEIGFWSEAALRPIFGVEQAYIDSVLDHIEAEGGIDRFLTGRVGVSPGVSARLRQDLLI